MKYLTKSNITFAIAVFGFVLSLWNFAKDLWNNRSKLSINCKLCNTGPINSRELIYFQLSIENHSRLPISISRMFFEYDEQSYEFGWVPEIILEKTSRVGGVIENKRTYLSEQLPHTIEGLGVWGGFFYINYTSPVKEGHFLRSPKHIKFHTNRGIKLLNLDIPEEIFNIKPKYI